MHCVLKSCRADVHRTLSSALCCPMCLYSVYYMSDYLPVWPTVCVCYIYTYMSCVKYIIVHFYSFVLKLFSNSCILRKALQFALISSVLAQNHMFLQNFSYSSTCHAIKIYQKGAGDTKVLDQMPVTHLHVTCMCRQVPSISK